MLMQSRTYRQAGTAYACPDHLIVTPDGDMYGWYPAEPPGQQYGGWYFIGSYEAAAVRLMAVFLFGFCQKNVMQGRYLYKRAGATARPTETLEEFPRTLFVANLVALVLGRRALVNLHLPDDRRADIRRK